MTEITYFLNVLELNGMQPTLQEVIHPGVAASSQRTISLDFLTHKINGLKFSPFILQKLSNNKIFDEEQEGVAVPATIKKF